MSSVKIELNSPGIREFLQSEDVQSIVREIAVQVSSRAGSGYESDVYVGKNRCNAAVWPETDEAKRDCYENNTLLKAVSG